MQRVSLIRDSPRHRLLAAGSLQWPEAPGGWVHLQVEPPLLGLGAASVFCLAGQGQLEIDFLPILHFLPHTNPVLATAL